MTIEKTDPPRFAASHEMLIEIGALRTAHHVINALEDDLDQHVPLDDSKLDDLRGARIVLGRAITALDALHNRVDATEGHLGTVVALVHAPNEDTPAEMVRGPRVALGCAVGDSLNSSLAVLMHRLEVASDKLDLVVAHYPNPDKCTDGDLGAVAVTRDVAREIAALYCEFSDSLHDAGLMQKGPWLDRFPEDLQAPENAPAEVNRAA